MEDKSDISSRKVGHIVIQWKIYNFIMAAEGPFCDWNIVTPAFYVRGAQVTKWKLAMHSFSRNNNNDISLMLERLDKEPEIVYGRWHVVIKDLRDALLSVNENQMFFQQYSVNEILIRTCSISENLSPFAVDTLCLNLQLFVSCKGTGRNFEKISDLGLKSLSRDLLALYKRGLFSDVEIDIKGKRIAAHKAILHARSPYFKRVLDKYPKISVIELSELDLEAVDKVLCYLYSGKPEFVFGGIPSSFLYESLQRLQIEELKQFYAPDDLCLESKCDTDWVKYIWNVCHLKDMNTTVIHSPPMYSARSQTVLSLRLFLKGEDGKSDFISLIVERLEKEEERSVCIEVGTVESNNSFQNTVRMWLKDNTRSLKVREFANRKILDVHNTVLSIMISIRMNSKDTVWHSSKTSRMNFLASPNETMHPYSRLSNDIGFLLSSGIHADINVFIGSESVKAHKCILAARSCIFSKKIGDIISSQATSVPNVRMDDEISSILMNYLYFGNLIGCEFKDISNIYSSADKYNIQTLKAICCQLMENNVTVENVSDVLIFSVHTGEEKLYHSVLKFVCANEAEVYEQQTWQQLTESRPFLCSEVEKFVKQYHASKT